MTPGWRSKTILTNRLQTILIWRIIIIKAETERLLIWIRQHHQWRQQHNTTPTPTQQPTPSTNISLKFVRPLPFFWKSEGAMRGCAESRAECRRWWKTVDGWCHCNGHGHCHWSIIIVIMKITLRGSEWPFRCLETNMSPLNQYVSMFEIKMSSL